MRETKERSFFLPLLILGVLLLGMLVMCVAPIVDCQLCSGVRHLLFAEGEFMPFSISSSGPIPEEWVLTRCDRCNEVGMTSLLKNWTLDTSEPPKQEDFEFVRSSEQ